MDKDRQPVGRIGSLLLLGGSRRHSYGASQSKALATPPAYSMLHFLGISVRYSSSRMPWKRSNTSAKGGGGRKNSRRHSSS